MLITTGFVLNQQQTYPSNRVQYTSQIQNHDTLLTNMGEETQKVHKEKK